MIYVIIYPYLVIDNFKLPRPEGVVEELSVVMAIVVWTVTLGMVGRCQHCHLVTVDGVVTEETLHFDSNLKISQHLLHQQRES